MLLEDRRDDFPDDEDDDGAGGGGDGDMDDLTDPLPAGFLASTILPVKRLPKASMR